MLHFKYVFLTPAEEINSYCFAKTVLYIFLAFFFIFLNQAEHEEHLTNSEKRRKEAKKDTSSEVVEAPRAEGYYCIEYNMLPDDPAPTRVDLVMFGLAAKLYMTNETKVNYWN